MNIKSALAATINQAMQEMNLSEADVAKRCGLDISTVRRLTRGTGKYITPSAALKLVQGMGISIERFMDELVEHQSIPDEVVNPT